jgi:hypothetical protein
MINGPPFWRPAEAARTERAAIKGWGPTLRLMALRAVAPACTAGSVYVLHLLGVLTGL